MEDLMMEKKEYGVWVETLVNSGGDFEIEYLRIFDNKDEAIGYYSDHRITIEEQKEDNFRKVMFIEDTNIMEKYIDVSNTETEEE